MKKILCIMCLTAVLLPILLSSCKIITTVSDIVSEIIDGNAVPSANTPQETSASIETNSDARPPETEGPYTYEETYDGLGLVFTGFVDRSRKFTETLVIPSVIDGRKVLEIDFRFSATEVKEIWLPEHLRVIRQHQFRDFPSLELVHLFNEIKAINQWAFAGGLVRIVLPESLESIEYEALAFNQITELFIPKGVTKLGEGCFRDCKKLERVVFEEGSRISEIPENAFSGCKNLREVVLPPARIIGSRAFAGTNIVELTIKEGTSRIGDAAFESSSLAVVNIPSSLKDIGYAPFARTGSLKRFNVSENNRWFLSDTNCLITSEGVLVQGVSDPVIPDGIIEIAAESFMNILGEIDFFIPKSVKKIGNDAFLNGKIKSVTFESGSELSEIGMYAFGGCHNLTEIRLPDKIKKISYYSFGNCEKLQTAYYSGTKKQFLKVCEGGKVVNVFATNDYPNSYHTDVVCKDVTIKKPQ